MIESTITYEQPLNELVRVCLRLEQLFLQIDHQIADTTALGTRNLMATIVNLLHMLDRPDLKTKLAKELSYHMTQLLRLERTPEIDQKKLQQLLQQVEELIRTFIDSSGKIGQGLREIELLNNLRLHLASPGGGCSFDIPVYHYWLQQPAESRLTMIRSWLEEFKQIRAAATIVLQLVREGAKVQAKTAEQGFFQELLDPQLNLRLIRVAIPADVPAYPEISIGRHFLSIRFFSPQIKERPTQYLQSFSFWVSFCNS